MKRKLEKPVKLDMSFDDALRRLISTEPAEVAESIEAEKNAWEIEKKLAAKSGETGKITARH